MDFFKYWNKISKYLKKNKKKVINENNEENLNKSTHSS